MSESVGIALDTNTAPPMCVSTNNTPLITGLINAKIIAKKANGIVANAFNDTAASALKKFPLFFAIKFTRVSNPAKAALKITENTNVPKIAFTKSPNSTTL